MLNRRSPCCLLLTACWLALTLSPAQGGDEPDPTANTAFQNRPVFGTISDRFEIYNPHSVEHLESIKSLGIQQVVLDWPNLHSQATKLGLDVVIANWWNKDTQQAEIDERLEFLKGVDRKHLAAVSMMDEPERYAPDTPFAYYKKIYSELRAKLKNQSLDTPLEISHWGPLESWSPENYQAFATLYQAADRIRLMPYPDLDEGPLDEIFYQMMRSRYIMKLSGRTIPQLVILQTWVIPDAPKLPTIKELRVMTYQAILTGADTISFFNYDPDVWKRTPGFRNGFRELMSELTEFTRQHRQRKVETTMSDSGVLSAVIDVSSHEILKVSINTQRKPIDQFTALEVKIERLNRAQPSTPQHSSPAPLVVATTPVQPSNIAVESSSVASLMNPCVQTCAIGGSYAYGRESDLGMVKCTEYQRQTACSQPAAKRVFLRRLFRR